MALFRWWRFLVVLVVRPGGRGKKLAKGKTGALVPL